MASILEELDCLCDLNAVPAVTRTLTKSKTRANSVREQWSMATTCNIIPFLRAALLLPLQYTCCHFQLHQIRWNDSSRSVLPDQTDWCPCDDWGLLYFLSTMSNLTLKNLEIQGKVTVHCNREQGCTFICLTLSLQSQQIKHQPLMLERTLILLFTGCRRIYVQHFEMLPLLSNKNRLWGLAAHLHNHPWWQRRQLQKLR